MIDHERNDPFGKNILGLQSYGSMNNLKELRKISMAEDPEILNVIKKNCPRFKKFAMFPVDASELKCKESFSGLQKTQIAASGTSDENYNKIELIRKGYSYNVTFWLRSDMFAKKNACKNYD